MDLHLEHLNRQLKTTMKHTCANINNASVKLAAESIDIVHNVCHQFEAETSECKANCDAHMSPSFDKDFKLISSVLREQDMFADKRNRYHPLFKFECSLMQQPRYENLVQWIKHTTTLIDK